MINKKKEPSKEKDKLHIRNKNRERYDFERLTERCPELARFVKLNPYNDKSIDFADPAAVKMLNRALLKLHYNIDYWDIPQNYLCPPIPGRADYIHHIADVLGRSNGGKIPMGADIKCLDIGVGANCIYPIIGHTEYGWSFIGSDIDPLAIESANKIIELNPLLKGNVECVLQNNPKDFFSGIITKNQSIDLSVCNPPFHASAQEAQSATQRKLNNLNDKKVKKIKLNFGGKSNELWCEGGEEQFVSDMIKESKMFATNFFWFSTLISKQSNLTSVYKMLEKAKAIEIETIAMGQGNKISRIVAWTFLTKEEQIKWKNTKWK